MLQAWAKIDSHAGRRFSVYVDKSLEAGTPPAEEEKAREAATLLLGLPWELLHDGQGFLFQGAKPARVRRRLPNSEALDVAVVAPPIRILLVTARLRPFLQALQAIVQGQRDPRLADAPELDYAMSAEILLLLETLGLE